MTLSAVSVAVAGATTLASARKPTSGLRVRLWFGMKRLMTVLRFRRFETRRCLECLRPAYKCDCEWVRVSDKYARCQSFGMASSVWREHTFEMPPGVVCIWDETPC